MDNIVFGGQINSDDNDPMAASPWSRDRTLMENADRNWDSLFEMIDNVLPLQVLAEGGVNTQIC